MTTATESPKRQPDRVISGLGGTGSGTGLVGAGFEFGADTTLGKLLIFISPVTSVAVGGLLFYFHVSWSRWLESRQAAKARRTIEEAINDPNLPDDVREGFRNQLAEFRKGIVAREIARAEAVGAVPEQPV